MKKFYAILIAIAMVAMFTVPAMAYDSTSSASGAVNQATGASTNSDYYSLSPASAGGNESSEAQFNATISENDGESASGNASVLGGITVFSKSTPNSSNSVAFGFTMGNSGNDKNYVEVFPNSSSPSYNVSISGDGSLSLGTQALTGSGNITYGWNQSLNGGQGGSDTLLNTGPNGAFATSGANGSYSYNANSNNGYLGWEGSGSVLGFSFSSAKTIPGGFNSLAGASITSTACPVGK